MNLKDLDYIINVADTKHFGQAAERCFVSQPTLSMQIKKLEEELGVTIFERNNKSVIITKVGQAIIDKARTILKEADTIKQLAAIAQDPDSATVRMSLIPTIGPYLLPRILSPLKKALPKLDLLLYEEKTEDALRKLQQGELDAAIMALPIDAHGLHIEKLYQEKFLIALPKQHQLNNRKTLTLNNIKQENLMLLTEGHCLRDQALDVCHFAKHNDMFAASSLETLRYMVVNGSGITLLPELAVNKDQKNISIKHFAKPEPYRDVIMVWREKSTLVETLQKLSQQIQETFL